MTVEFNGVTKTYTGGTLNWNLDDIELPCGSGPRVRTMIYRNSSGAAIGATEYEIECEDAC